MKRRDFLKAPAGAGLGALAATGCAGAFPGVSSRRSPRSDLIRAENEKPGTSEWQLTRAAVDPATRYRSPWIEGYCSRTSVRHGERLDIMVSTNPASAFTIDVYRLGYYGGKGGRHVQSLGRFAGTAQPDPGVGNERVRECRWEPATSVVIPQEWPSGVYLGKLTAATGGFQSYVIFIVRDDRPCDFLFQCSDTTWSAYNRWPSTWSLYDDGKRDVAGWYVGPGVSASWDRPYGKYRQVVDHPLSQGSGTFLLFEYPFCYWMEKEGYDVSYISGADTHADRAGLLRAKTWLSIGHDEYWSVEQFENVKAAIAAGVNAAFFSGDTCTGLIPYLPSGAGAPHRIISRAGYFGFIEERTIKHFPELATPGIQGPNEGTLMGVRNIWPYNGTTDWICSDQKHWMFDGTGMKNGDRIPGLLGFEWMGAPSDIPGLRVVASGPIGAGENQATYAATIYPGPKGNSVFTASTIWWGDGLAAPPGYLRPSKLLRGPDPRVQRITTNLFQRFSG